MESAKPSVYTSGNAEGIDRVRKEDGAYAFFMEAASIEYHIERKCDLMQLGGLLDSKGYGVALPPSKFIIWIQKWIMTQKWIMIQKLDYDPKMDYDPKTDYDPKWILIQNGF